MGESFKKIIMNQDMGKSNDSLPDQTVNSPRSQVEISPFQGINKKIFEPFYISNTTKLLFENSHNRSIVDIVRCFVKDSKQNNIKVYFSINLIDD